jgi:hypothetical protein
LDIQAEVARLLNDSGATHKRHVEYVVRQVRGGRHIAEVLEDPYVTNRATPLERRALLEEPEVVDAVGDEVLKDLKAQLEALVNR